MKIAVFHQFLDNIGGAEIVALTFARELDADIYTTNVDRDRIAAMGFRDLLERIHSIGSVPREAPWRHQLAFLRFRRLNLAGQYDRFIIAGDWAMSAAVNHHPNIWYVHSPLNELWAFKDYVKNERLPARWMRPVYEGWVRMNRFLNLRYLRSVDTLTCNSKNTQERIARFYNRGAHVIHPPIDTSRYYYASSKNYWLSVNRLFNNKRVEIQLEAFRNLPDERLIVVGSYEDARHFKTYARRILETAPPNVEIRHWVSRQELADLYAHCRGFITTAQNEDFGMTPIEAMASGKPVIAPSEGGYRESVIDGATGTLIDEITPKKLAGEIRRLSQHLNRNAESYRQACQDRARAFDTAAAVTQLRCLL